MVVADRNRASSISVSDSFFLFLSHENVCDRTTCLFNFFPNFFFLCRCMSWGFKNFKAGLLTQSMPTSGILRERK